MRELSLHIMDMIENGLTAGALLIQLTIREDTADQALQITVEDDGKGIEKNMLEKVLDPFYTTRTTRRVGLGLSLFREACLRCGGEFSIESEPSRGTRVSATFRLDNIDLPPLGNLASAFAGLIAGNPAVDFIYRHIVNNREFQLDTRDIKHVLDGVPISDPEVYCSIRGTIQDSLAELKRC